MTPNDAIKSALSLLGVLAEGETPNAEQSSDGLDEMNDMIFGWKTSGLDIGHYEVDLNDEMIIPPEARRAVKYNLAVALSPHYEVEPSMLLALKARKLWAALFACNLEIEEMTLDSTLTRRTYYDITTS